MNLLEHYVKEVKEVTDITADFKEKSGYTPKEPLYEITMEIDCMGVKECVKEQFFETEWNTIKERGYYLA